ncbi:MAG: hypothetical protein ACK5NT_13330 [Pyrinomonadaceae bacterium]
MQSKKFKLLVAAVLMMTVGLASVFAANDDKKKQKRPKNTGVLSIKTTPNPLTVRVDGQVVGVSGTSEAAEFYLTPGVHLVEIEGPNGKTFTKELNIEKNVKNCICLNVVEKTVTKQCPYDISVSNPDVVKDGDLVTFVTMNAVTGGSAILNYLWSVSPGAARVTSGLGTSAITVDTTGLGGQIITANLEVTDGIYDASCRQRVAGIVKVDKIEIPIPSAPLFDEFPTVSNDDDKARLDGLALELQNNPSYQGYIIMYPGTNKISKTRNPERLAKMTYDYLVNKRGVDPSRLSVVQGGTRTQTTYQIWLVPPGAKTPVPQ